MQQQWDSVASNGIFSSLHISKYFMKESLFVALSLVIANIFGKIPNSQQLATNALHKFSPEWGPERSTKSIKVSLSSQSFVIQCAVIARKEYTFGDVHTSNANE